MSPPHPLVAVAAYHLAQDRVSRWPKGGYGVPAPYVERARAAGARTAIIAPGEPGDPQQILAPFDALLLVGGGDIHPARYGAEPGDALYGVEPDRDAFEIDLVREAVRAGLPTLCICRGMQVLNVALGGTLHQDLPVLAHLLAHGIPVDGTEAMHEVVVEDGTRLSAATGGGALACSSHHHQGVDRVADGLRVSARSADGLVEGLELPEGSTGWTVAVQWHPEDTADGDPSQQGLFDELARRATR